MCYHIIDYINKKQIYQRSHTTTQTVHTTKWETRDPLIHWKRVYKIYEYFVIGHIICITLYQIKDLCYGESRNIQFRWMKWINNVGLHLIERWYRLLWQSSIFPYIAYQYVWHMINSLNYLSCNTLCCMYQSGPFRFPWSINHLIVIINPEVQAFPLLSYFPWFVSELDVP